MSTNLGMMDRALRAVIGLYLIAFATKFGFPATGFNHFGWLGILPLATAVLGYSPVYHLLGFSTAPREPREPSVKRWHLPIR